MKGRDSMNWTGVILVLVAVTVVFTVAFVGWSLAWWRPGLLAVGAGILVLVLGERVFKPWSC